MYSKTIHIHPPENKRDNSAPEDKYNIGALFRATPIARRPEKMLPSATNNAANSMLLAIKPSSPKFA